MFESIIELQKAQGQKAKASVLRKYQFDNEFRSFLYYALTPTLAYNLSEKTIRMAEGDKIDLSMPLVFFDDVFSCCEYLASLRGIDDASIRQVKVLIYGQKRSAQERELLIRLFARTLRLGVTAKTVNKIIPRLIPAWEVQQAFPIDRYPIEPGTEFWLTQKLNGNRATFYRGKMIARSGTPYTGLEHITRSVIQFCVEHGVVLDGELILKDNNGLSDNEAFRKATGILNSDGNKTSICFTVFDMIPLTDFDSANPKVPYSVRRRALDRASRALESDCVHVLPVLYHGRDQSKIDVLLDKMVSEDKEGLMVNTDVPYIRDRHRGILKVKRFYTMDLPVVGAEEGSGRLSDMLGALILDYKGNEVKVGTGFSDEQRRTFWRGEESLDGALCEVKYKEISYDKKTGKESLQFPVFVRLRTDKTEVSYG